MRSCGTLRRVAARAPQLVVRAQNKMSDIYEAPHNIPDEFEYIDSEEELQEKIDQITPYVGRIIIELNSLETVIDLCIKELASQSEAQDRYVYTFLSKMEYRAKVNVLASLYGDIVESFGYPDLRDPLKKLKTMLVNACEKRNIYAHTDWTDISKGNLVATKYTANRNGVFRVYRTFEISDMENDINHIIEASETLENFDEILNDKVTGYKP